MFTPTPVPAPSPGLSFFYLSPTCRQTTCPVDQQPLAAGGVGLQQVLNHLQVVPEHCGIHNVLSDLVLLGQLEVSGSVQEAWQDEGAVARPKQDGWLLAMGQEAASYGDQLLDPVQMTMHDVMQPPTRVVKGDKQHMLQLMGLQAQAWVVGCHGGVWTGWDTCN